MMAIGVPIAVPAANDVIVIGNLMIALPISPASALDGAAITPEIKNAANVDSMTLRILVDPLYLDCPEQEYSAHLYLPRHDQIC